MFGFSLSSNLKLSEMHAYGEKLYTDQPFTLQ